MSARNIAPRKQAASEKESHQQEVSQLLRARAREDELDEIMEYAEDIGLKSTPGMRGFIAKRLKNGVEKAVFDLILDETAMAPRPSWPYFCAIIRRLESKRVKTVDDYMADRCDWAMLNGQNVWENCYERTSVRLMED